jgi:DNA-binding response OmpR family regulator
MDKPIQILMVEDDINLGFLVRENFSAKGYHVHLAHDGNEGWQAFSDRPFDLVLLDIMMPRKDGISLAKQIRRENQHIPIIFLTAKSMEHDKIEGFEAGCDDYMTKPFSAKELQLRISAILRRTLQTAQTEAPAPGSEMQIGRFLFDFENRQLKLGSEARKLSTKEADLLRIFGENINLLLNRNVILNRVWGNDDYFSAKSMDVYLTRIRKILRADPDLEIQNVHGTGFRLLKKE